MKTIARSLKSLSLRLHPPVIASPQDSQRLLSHLKKSFEEQFDREHSAQSRSNEHNTNSHLQAILTNPLFDAKPRKPAALRDKERYDRKHLGLLRERKHVERPMEAFKERVSQGTADLEMAKLFLGLQLRACLASPVARLSEAMRSSGVAASILPWLWSSGLEDAGKFLFERDFLRLLIPFLVADGQHARIQRWLSRYPDFDKTPSSSPGRCHAISPQKFLLATLVKEEIKTGGGLESAITLYHRTVETLRLKQSVELITTSAAWILTTTIVRLPKAAEPEDSIIQLFLKCARSSVTDPLLRATLCAYVQKPPDPRPALMYLETLSTEELLLWGTSRRTRLVLLGLKAADMFLQDGRQTEALWVMKFLQTKFAQEVGSVLPHTRKMSVPDKPRTISSSENILQSLYTLQGEGFLSLPHTLTVH